MALPPWLIRALRIVVALACVVIAGWYSPELTAAGWRVFNPLGRVEYRGLRVRVPWRWTAQTNGDKEDASVAPMGVSLRKAARHLGEKGPPETIFVTVISSDDGLTEDQQTDAWLAVFRMTHPGVQFENQPPAEVPQNVSCMGTRSEDEPKDEPRVVWTCISVRNGWVANFEGRISNVPVFFWTVERLRR
jgi:hypothetical protein